MTYEYIERFKELSLGLFVHFGLYSKVGKGEWYLALNPGADKIKYRNLTRSFCVKKNWAKELAAFARQTGFKYITLTTRHHDGFSLFDTCGLNDYDAPHSACGRDLVKEFVDACRNEGIVPFFYHTLLDWNEESYENDFPAYIDYLVKSVEILCKNYGKIGGFWFDGWWNKKNADWQFDRLYGTIRKYQPQAMIINNTGLSELGKVGHKEIDSVTFERGKPCFVDNSDKPRAGEMCQVLNDHWGYTRDDCNYKSVKELIGNLIDCRKFNCNFLLNIGLKGNGSINPLDKCFLREIGKWIKFNKNIIYSLKSCDIKAENADLLYSDGYYYAVVRNVPMVADPNVQRVETLGKVKIYGKIVSAFWLDNGEKIETEQNEFFVKPFSYGTSYSVRIAKLIIERSE